MSQTAVASSSVLPPMTPISWHGADFLVDVGACRRGIALHLLREGGQLHDLAQAAGVSRMSLWRFMQGRKCAPSTVHAILLAAGIELGQVVVSTLS